MPSLCVRAAGSIQGAATPRSNLALLPCPACGVGWCDGVVVWWCGGSGAAGGEGMWIELNRFKGALQMVEASANDESLAKAKEAFDEADTLRKGRLSYDEFMVGCRHASSRGH